MDIFGEWNNMPDKPPWTLLFKVRKSTVLTISCKHQKVTSLLRYLQKGFLFCAKCRKTVLNLLSYEDFINSCLVLPLYFPRIVSQERRRDSLLRMRSCQALPLPGVTPGDITYKEAFLPVLFKLCAFPVNMVKSHSCHFKTSIFYWWRQWLFCYPKQITDNGW